jgi:hypothetical protein
MESIIHVVRITVLRRSNFSDLVMLHTDLPPSYYPFNESPTVSFDAAKGEGVGYCTRLFLGVPLEVVDE